MHKRQRDNYERILKCVTHLIYLLVEKAKSDEQKVLMHQLVHGLVKQNPRSVYIEDTLLHLCVSSSNTINSSYFTSADDIHVSMNFCSSVSKELKLYSRSSFWKSFYFQY